MNGGDWLLDVANLSIVNQKTGDEDYYDEEGLLVCGKCHAQKQIRIDSFLPGGGVNKLVVACMCECELEKQRKKEKLMEFEKEMLRVEKNKEASLMDSRTKNSTFENFVVNQYNEKVLARCKEYVDNFHKMLERNQGLLFWGDVGTGKSYAAACIANALLEKGEVVVMTSFVKILDMIQNGNIDYGIITKPKLVIFDDFGAERATDYALEKIYMVMDERYRSKMPMIVTTNIELSDMKKDDDLRYKRIYQRILEGCFPVHFTGTNWRMKEAGRRFEEMRGQE